MAEIVPSGDFKTELVQGGMKAAMSSSGAKSRDLLMVPIDQIKTVAGLNVRIHDEEYEAHTEEIKISIIENGFYQHFPLSGYAGKEGDSTFIYCTGGFTRLEAARRAIKEGAAIDALPMVLKPNGTSMLDLTLALAQDNTGSPLRPYERAIVIKRAVGYGAEEGAIARRMGVSKQYVTDLLYLLGLPNTVQQMVIGGQVSAGHAIATARKHGVDATKVLQDALGPPQGNGADPAAGSTGGHVSPARTRSTATGKVPKFTAKVIFSAIDYAITLPQGLEFLARWRKAETDAIAELNAFVATPKVRVTKASVKAAATAKRKAEAAVKKAEAAANTVWLAATRKAATAAGKAAAAVAKKEKKTPKQQDAASRKAYAAFVKEAKRLRDHELKIGAIQEDPDFALPEDPDFALPTERTPAPAEAEEDIL